MLQDLKMMCVQVLRCAVSPKGDKAVTATEDHRVQIWDLPCGRQLHDLPVRYQALLMSLHSKRGCCCCQCSLTRCGYCQYSLTPCGYIQLHYM